MFSYDQIARWLTKPVDPITVEDWLANREIFGSQKDDEYLEKAYQMETALEAAKSGEIVEKEEDLIFKSADGGEAWIYGEKVRAIALPSGKIIIETIELGRPVKIKIRTGKKEVSWMGSGKEKIIFDLR